MGGTREHKQREHKQALFVPSPRPQTKLVKTGYIHAYYDVITNDVLITFSEDDRGGGEGETPVVSEERMEDMQTLTLSLGNDDDTPPSKPVAEAKVLTNCQRHVENGVQLSAKLKRCTARVIDKSSLTSKCSNTRLWTTKGYESKAIITSDNVSFLSAVKQTLSEKSKPSTSLPSATKLPANVCSVSVQNKAEGISRDISGLSIQGTNKQSGAAKNIQVTSLSSLKQEKTSAVVNKHALGNPAKSSIVTVPRVIHPLANNQNIRVSSLTQIPTDLNKNVKLLNKDFSSGAANSSKSVSSISLLSEGSRGMADCEKATLLKGKPIGLIHLKGKHSP